MSIPPQKCNIAQTPAPAQIPGITVIFPMNGNVGANNHSPKPPCPAKTTDGPFVHRAQMQGIPIPGLPRQIGRQKTLGKKTGALAIPQTGRPDIVGRMFIRPYGTYWGMNWWKCLLLVHRGHNPFASLREIIFFHQENSPQKISITPGKDNACVVSTDIIIHRGRHTPITPNNKKPNHLISR